MLLSMWDYIIAKRLEQYYRLNIFNCIKEFFTNKKARNLCEVDEVEQAFALCYLPHALVTGLGPHIIEANYSVFLDLNLTIKKIYRSALVFSSPISLLFLSLRVFFQDRL